MQTFVPDASFRHDRLPPQSLENLHSACVASMPTEMLVVRRTPMLR